MRLVGLMTLAMLPVGGILFVACDPTNPDPVGPKPTVPPDRPCDDSRQTRNVVSGQCEDSSTKVECTLANYTLEACRKEGNPCMTSEGNEGVFALGSEGGVECHVAGLTDQNCSGTEVRDPETKSCRPPRAGDACKKEDGSDGVFVSKASAGGLECGTSPVTGLFLTTQQNTFLVAWSDADKNCYLPKGTRLELIEGGRVVEGGAQTSIKFKALTIPNETCNLTTGNVFTSHVK